MKTLNAKEIRNISAEDAKRLGKKVKRKDIYLVLEDIFDTYNVGGFFRLADGVAAKKIFLCGRTETPPNPKIKKSSVGTYRFTPWEYKENVEQVVEELKKIKDIKIVAIEQHKKSIDYRKASYIQPIAFILGSEVNGLSKKAAKLSDEIVEIPMYGINKSLNVMVAAGIVIHKALE